ncbi:MAG: EVE domain-containing protein [Verrucomicrobia bacterium]|nr:EVE domain-containing protein [Verrucomicrobiota bacterium]MCH8511746.1 EVE domain-containing protein [Kiritimatiellia bacterium]
MQTPQLWLIKFAPFRTAWEEIVARGNFTLRGVRNLEARKNLNDMRLGDHVLFYRSQKDQAVVGILEVSQEAYPDPTSAADIWLTCDFKPIRTLSRPVTLTTLRQDPRLEDIPLLRQPRLAVMPLSQIAFALILEKSHEPS